MSNVDPLLDTFLGVIVCTASVVAVIGNLIAMFLMGYIAIAGRAKFTTLIYLNIAFINFVIGCTSWIVIGPALLSRDRNIPPWYMDKSSTDEICKYFLVNTEKILPAIVLYSITYMAMAKVLLYSNPLKHPNRHYLLSFRTTLIVLIHFWAITTTFCMYPVTNGGSEYKKPVAKCVYKGMPDGKQELVAWLSLYNFIFVILPLLVLLLVSSMLISQLYQLNKTHTHIFKDSYLNSAQIWVKIRSKKEMFRTILFGVNCLLCYSGIMFVALCEFVDLMRNTQKSTVTQERPYAVVVGLGIMFTVNAAINPWIYLVKNDAFKLLQHDIRSSMKKRKPEKFKFDAATKTNRTGEGYCNAYIDAMRRYEATRSYRSGDITSRNYKSGDTSSRSYRSGDTTSKSYISGDINSRSNRSDDTAL